MPCKSCGSHNLSKLRGELALHFPGLQGLEKPIVWVFPDVLVCLDCGNGEFGIPEKELQVIAKEHILPKERTAKAG